MQVFQDLFSCIAHLDTQSFSQKSIQQAFDIEKFQGLKKDLPAEKVTARFLSLSFRHTGACLCARPIPALGLHMAPNAFGVSAKYRLGVLVYNAERKFPFYNAGVLDLCDDYTTACHGRGDAIAKN